MSDPDLDRWTAAWRQGTPDAAGLAGKARRERRWLLAWIAGDWAAGVGLVGFAGWLWFADGSTTMRFAAAGIVVLVVAALAFTTLNWRGTLANERASAAEFLALAERRARARLRYVRFGWWVLAADLVVIAGACWFLYLEEGAARLPKMAGMAVAAILAAAAILWWWSRRERRRAERLAALRRAVAANLENGHD
ncbi:MAG: hypothetical protein ACT4UP_07150 [Gammaproteobacteria bacterium]